MNKVEEITLFSELQRVISIFQRVSQLSWTVDQTRKRYTSPSIMTPEEMTSLLRTLLALGLDLEEIYKEWRKEYGIYKNNKS